MGKRGVKIGNHAIDRMMNKTLKSVVEGFGENS